MKTIVSKQGTLQGRDYWKALIIGAVTAAMFGAIDALRGVESILDLDWVGVAQAALAGFIGYVVKNLAETTKVATIIEGEEAKAYIADHGTNPPPLGDPTHPKKP